MRSGIGLHRTGWRSGACLPDPLAPPEGGQPLVRLRNASRSNAVHTHAIARRSTSP